MGAIFMTRSIWATEKLETPIQRTFPSRWRSAMVDQPTLFDVFVGLGPVELVEVDGFELQAAEARFALAADLFLGVGDLFLIVPDHGGLGEDVRFVRGGLDGPGYDLFGVAEAVDGGGVDPVDAEVESFVDC